MVMVLRGALALVIVAALAGLIWVGGKDIRAAHDAIAAQTTIDADTAVALLDAAAISAQTAPDRAVELARIQRELPQAVGLVGIQVGSRDQTFDPPAPKGPKVPEWYSYRVVPVLAIDRHPIMLLNGAYTEGVVLFYPGEMLVKAWTDWRNKMLILSAISAAIAAALWAALHFAVRREAQAPEVEAEVEA